MNGRNKHRLETLPRSHLLLAVFTGTWPKKDRHLATGAGFFWTCEMCQMPSLTLVGGSKPSEKYLSIGMIIPNTLENKKCSKPPTRLGLGRFKVLKPTHTKTNMICEPIEFAENAWTCHVKMNLRGQNKQGPPIKSHQLKRAVQNPYGDLAAAFVSGY